MTSLLAGALLVLAAGGPTTQDECFPESSVQPGRWQVESIREGEPPTLGVADITRMGGDCLLVERLLLHFEDGTSHHVYFLQGWDPDAEQPRLVQLGDHPLFLVWEAEPGREAYRTTRSTSRGTVQLRWVVRERDDGFERELLVRRGSDTTWSSSEVATYRPLDAVATRSELPALRPGPFHDPEACDGPEYRKMDYLLGDWFNDEWLRDGGRWLPGTVSEVTVRPLIGGCALLEEHPIYDGGELERRLVLLRGYDSSEERWRQFVFDPEGGVWEWDLEERSDGWLVTPAGGEMEGRIRIFERADADSVLKRVESRGEDGTWRLQRLIRYARP